MPIPSFREKLESERDPMTLLLDEITLSRYKCNINQLIELSVGPNKTQVQVYCWLNTDKVTCFSFFKQKMYRNVPHRTTTKLLTEFALQDTQLNCILAISEWAVLYHAILWFWWIDI